MWGRGCRFGGPGSSRRLPGAPGHVVHVDHGVDGQQHVCTGDADDVKQAVDHQAGLLRMHERSEEVQRGDGDDEDAAGSQDGFVLHDVAWGRTTGRTMRLG